MAAAQKLPSCLDTSVGGLQWADHVPNGDEGSRLCKACFFAQLPFAHSAPFGKAGLTENSLQIARMTKIICCLCQLLALVPCELKFTLPVDLPVSDKLTPCRYRCALQFRLAPLPT